MTAHKTGMKLASLGRETILPSPETKRTEEHRQVWWVWCDYSRPTYRRDSLTRTWTTEWKWVLFTSSPGEATKMRIVHDAFSKTGCQPSLDDCLLVRGRFPPVALNGEIRKAILQVSILPEHRDSIGRRTRIPNEFSLCVSAEHYLAWAHFHFCWLPGVLQCHLNASNEKNTKRAEWIEPEYITPTQKKNREKVTGTPVQEVGEKKLRLQSKYLKRRHSKYTSGNQISKS